MDKALAIQKEVQRVLQSDEVYLVGGSVRDLVLGHEPKDYDFCTSLTVEEMKPRIQEAGRKVYKIGRGEKHGTYQFKIEDSPRHFTMVEVTTFRTETYDGKSRQPNVTFVRDLDEDLSRRDFTFNAMVLKSDGSIYDPYGGRIDILGKLIKTVGKPKDRIIEDPLRILRAARFAARYGFKIDPNFIGKARQLADRIYNISIERWVQELDKLLVSEHYYAGMEALQDMGMLERILPEQYDYPDGPAENADLAWKAQLRNVNEDPLIAKYMAVGICQRLKFSNDRTAIVLDKKK